jgi:RelE-like toxin of type II toxin-antitoxin system HigB
MIESFRHKGLRQLFEDGDRSKLRPDLVRRIGIVLAALDDAHTVNELDRPGFKLHPLKGEFAGFWERLGERQLADRVSVRRRQSRRREFDRLPLDRRHDADEESASSRRRPKG